MAKITGKYYDGKISKPYDVTVAVSGNWLNISTEDYTIRTNWKIEDCTINNLTNDKVINIKYGSFPHQILEVQGESADKMLEILGDSIGFVEKSYQSILRKNPISLLLGSAITLAVIFFGYITYVSPFVGERAANLVSKDMEAALGQNAFNQMGPTLDIDSTKTVLLQEFYEVCGFDSEYDIQLHFSNNQIVNAFALPGGKIVIFDGLVQRMESWEELAGLIGHEKAHVDQKHAVKNLTRSLSSYIVFSAMLGDASGVSSILIENVNMLNEMANSRAYETEADMEGLETLRQLKIKPEAMQDLFKRLMTEKETPPTNAEKDSLVLDIQKHDSLKEDTATHQNATLDTLISGLKEKLEILSTHPLSEDRINYLGKEITSNDIYNYEPVQIERAKEIFELLKNNVQKKDEDPHSGEETHQQY